MLSVRGRQRGEQENESARAQCLCNFLGARCYAEWIPMLLPALKPLEKSRPS
jgi:hypothetical protein